jgi:hypothetical protein
MNSQSIKKKTAVFMGSAIFDGVPKSSLGTEATLTVRLGQILNKDSEHPTIIRRSSVDSFAGQLLHTPKQVQCSKLCCTITVISLAMSLISVTQI